jgi:hypothetical protein
MNTLRSSIQKFIRVSEALIKLQNLSDVEYKAVREMLVRLDLKFPDMGDDAAD